MKTIPPELEGEYTVRVMDMPVSTPGFVTYDEDDHANIYLNARYSREKNRRTAAHELTHVLHDDIHNADPIQVIESRAPVGEGGSGAAGDERGLASSTHPPPTSRCQHRHLHPRPLHLRRI